MKKLSLILIFLAVLAFSCSKDGTLNTGPTADQLSGNAALKRCGNNVVKVYPGPNDTQAIIDAFAQAQAYGKNAVVKLMPGTFTIDMLEVKEFNGTFCGSGMGKTIITNIPSLIPDAASTLNKVPALITFIGGDVSVSDMTVKMPEALSWLGGNTGGLYEMNMLLFSDYSADFTPGKKQIEVYLNNIEVTGPLKKNVTQWDGSVIDAPFGSFYGVKFAPDILDQYTAVLRCNIDATVNNSKFSNFSRGVYVWGCKSGSFRFGTDGGNIFTGNWEGLALNENIGINVKIINNEITCPAYLYDPIDLNTGEAMFGSLALETVQVDAGNYEIRDNVLNMYQYAYDIGIWDGWRYVHPENPSWMKIICDHNTFNDFGDENWFNINGPKNAVFSNNKIAGTGLYGGFYLTGLYSQDPTTGEWYVSSWSENCKVLNNIILQENYTIYLDSGAENCLILGDLTNVTVADYGVNNKVIGLKNPGHRLPKECADKIGRMHDDMHNRHNRH